MYKLDLEKAMEQKSNCQYPLNHRKSKEIPEKHLLCLYWLQKSFDYVDHNKMWKILRDLVDYQTTSPVSWETCMQLKKQQLEPDIK